MHRLLQISKQLLQMVWTSLCLWANNLLTVCILQAATRKHLLYWEEEMALSASSKKLDGARSAVVNKIKRTHA